MTTIDLEYPREEAVELVKAAFEKTPTILEYRSVDDDQRIIGETRSGVLSFGSEVVVRIPLAQENPDVTSITVRAKRNMGLNRSSNPWKHKSNFLDRLTELRGQSFEEFQRTGETREVQMREIDSEDTETAERNVTAEAWMRTSKAIFFLLSAVLGLVFLYVIYVQVVG